MTENEFYEMYVTASAKVADMFYPKNEYQTTGTEVDLDLNGEPIKTERSQRRGEYLRDQGVLYSRLLDALKEKGVIREVPHEKCIHYQYIEGRMVEVDKDDWYDYCTAEPRD